MLFEEVNAQGKTLRKKWDDLSTPQKALAIGGTLTVTYILIRGIGAVAGRPNVIKAPVDYGQIPGAYVDPISGASILWNPDPLAQELANNLEGYNLFVYPETVEKILQLNDDQIRLLYNHYNTYFAQDKPTLTQLIDSEWSDTSGTYSRAVQRMKGLGLL